MKKIILVATSISALLFPLGKPVSAEELIISGNGDGSTSNINIQNSQQTTVQQSNQAEVTNNVDNSANTGGNAVNDNTGGNAGISTGAISSETSIENSLNSSVVEAGCCPSGSQLLMSISGNGADSQNTIDSLMQNKTTITVAQNASVNNQVNTNASTGNNSANDNNGNVSIDTGNITISERIENSFINLAYVSAGGGGQGDVTIKIVNNGASSQNSIFPKWFIDNFITIKNTSDISNIINTNVNTGGNSANGNNGDVDITTGDITIGIRVKNDVNKSIVDVSCCPKEEDKNGEDPKDPPTGGPTTPSGGGSGNGGGGGGSNSGGGSGSTLGAAVGNILPATGFNWMLATMANVIMFLFGLYLRRRSGNSPGLAALRIAA